MKRLTAWSGVLSATGIFATLAGCPQGGLSVCDDGNCDAPDGFVGDGSSSDGADGSRDGMAPPVEGGMLDAPAGCMLTDDPSVVAACVDESIGVFVDSVKGNDTTGMGTKASPYKSIGQGILKAGPKRVYVCAGNYGETVSMDATHAASVYGGFSCSNWSYAVGNAVTVKPTTPTYALRMASVGGAVLLQDVELDAPDGDATQVNSIAAFVSSSVSVTMKRVKLVAGTGFSPAMPDAPASNFAAVTAGMLNGKNAADANGGGADLITCGDMKTSSGGKGGDGAGGAAGAGAPPHGGGGGTAGANAVVCGGGGTSATADGDNAPATSSDSPPPKAGSVDPVSGWLPASGAKGSNGLPGQGAGGGGNGKDNLGGGGGGAAGGCGGAGGAGGAGGGASIGLLTTSAPISLLSSTATGGTAGAGAMGTAGETGQKGGVLGGTPYSDGVHAAGCAGGAGGAGAGGNGGGGGASGVSFGVLSAGQPPVLDASSSGTGGTVTTNGQGGSAGGAASGGNSGAGGGPGPTASAAGVKRVEDL